MATNRSNDDKVVVEKIVQAIARAHWTFDSFFVLALGEVAPEVSRAEFSVLAALAAEGARRTTDVSYDLALAPSSMTRYCDQLYRLGLITRERESQDRREVRMDLTTKGRKVVEAVTALREKALGGRISELNVTDRRHLLRSLGRVAGDVELFEEKRRKNA